MTGRLPSPGPSFARAQPLRLRGAAGELGPRIRLGMTRPTVMVDDWWVFTLWAEDDDGVIECRTVAPPAGPPPAPPLLVMGPSFSNALMGLLDQEDGRQLIRLRMAEVEEGSDAWARPLMMLTAVRWDPVRRTTMRDNELVGELMRAFRRAIDVAGAAYRPES
jgi:hypothetical protein